MMNNKRQLNLLLILGTIVYATLLFFSVHFYMERMTMLDDSFQLFEVIRKKSFAIQSYRFGEMFSQVFPLIGAYLGLSLKTCTILYSISFVLFPAFCFYWVLLGFKNEKIALVILLYNTLLMAHAFYWVICEVMHGVAFTLLYIAYVEKQLQQQSRSKLFLLLSPFALVTIVFFYPLLPLVMFVALLCLWLYYEKKHTRFFIVLMSVYLAIFVLKALFISSNYDHGAMSRIKNVSLFFKHYFGLPSFHIFLKYFLQDYFVFLIAWLIATIALLWLKKFVPLTILLLSTVGFFIFLAIMYPDGDKQFYLEPQFTLLTVFLVIPISYFVVPNVRNSIITLSALCILLTLSLMKIYNTSNHYVARVNWMRSILQEMENTNIRKLILSEQRVPTDLLLLTWSAPTEFWILSTIEKKETYSVLIEEHAGEFDQYLVAKTLFANKWGAFEYRELDSRYFMLKDTSTTYQKYRPK